MDSLHSLWGKLGLRARVLLLAAMFLGVGALLVNFSETQRMAAEYREDLSHEMDNTMDLLEISISDQAIIGGDYMTIQKIIESRVRKPLVERISWYDAEGQTLHAAGSKTAAKSPGWFGMLVDLKQPAQSREIAVGGYRYGTVTVYFSTITLENRMWKRWWRQSLETLLFVLAFVAIIWVTLRDGLRPLEGVAAVARRFMAGDYKARMPVYPHLAPEMRDTLEMVNQSTERIGALLLSLSEQQRATDNAAIVVESDTRGIITYVNDKFCEISGYSRGELLGRDHRFLKSGYHPPEFFTNMWATLKAGRIWYGEVCNRARDGSLFWVDTTITPVAGTDGQPVKYIGVRFDITARKLAEDALRASEANYRRIVETAQEGICVIDVRGVITYLNQRMADMLGHSVLEMQELPLLDFMDEASRAEARQKLEHRVQGEGRRHDFCFRHKDGSEVWTIVSTNPICDEAGKVVGALGMVSDITERKRTEMKIEESREQLRRLSSHLQRVREEEKASIAREIHDELGGTLTALKMDIFWLTRKLPNNLEAVFEKTEAMSALVDSAVQTTRRICTELRPTILDDLGLVAAIEWQTREYEKRTGIECVINLAESEMPLSGACSIALFRILQESLTNIARYARATRVEVDLHRDGDGILMQIKDNGVGISEDKVLNPLSHGIRGMIERARDLGGTLLVGGAPGQGVEICARIPLPQTEKVET